MFLVLTCPYWGFGKQQSLSLTRIWLDFTLIQDSLRLHGSVREKWNVEIWISKGGHSFEFNEFSLISKPFCPFQGVALVINTNGNLPAEQEAVVVWSPECCHGYFPCCALWHRKAFFCLFTYSSNKIRRGTVMEKMYIFSQPQSGKFPLLFMWHKTEKVITLNISRVSKPAFISCVTCCSQLGCCQPPGTFLQR